MNCDLFLVDRDFSPVERRYDEWCVYDFHDLSINFPPVIGFVEQSQGHLAITKFSSSYHHKTLRAIEKKCGL